MLAIGFLARLDRERLLHLQVAEAATRIATDINLLRADVSGALAAEPGVSRMAAAQTYARLLSHLPLIEGEWPAEFALLEARRAEWDRLLSRFVAGDDASGYEFSAQALTIAPQLDRAALVALSRYREQQVKTSDNILIVRIVMLGFLALGLGIIAYIAVLLERRTRAAEGAQQELRQTMRHLDRARIEAEAANRAKSNFLASMSHELRTPLNAVIGFADVMRQGLFGPIGNARYQEYLVSIQQSGQHLLSLINDVLDMSRIEAGRMELNEDRVDIKASVKLAFAQVRVQAARKEIALVENLVADVEALWADERAFLQVLINLLNNAVKFTPEQGRIEVGSRLSPKGWLEIAIKDTGVGIAEQDQARIFEPFARAGSAKLQQSAGGTGLGLAITQRLVELHGGRVSLVSHVGQGTTVTLAFPPERISRVADFGAALSRPPPRQG
jgi:signal transduction histidine kinase